MLLASKRERLCDLFRPVIRHLPRGKGRFLSLLTGGLSHKWQHARKPWRCFYDQSIGAWFLVDLRDWVERIHYYCGTPTDFWNAAIIESLLAAGDTYIDIGANIGNHTLRAARVVKSNGHVYSFEANPQTAARLRLHMQMNEAKNVSVFEMALSDRDGEAQLKPAGELHAGTYTLEGHGQGANGYSVKLMPGDQVFPGLVTTGRILVKIDVEGHEYHVLKGISGWLSAKHPILTMEYTSSWLSNSGSRGDDVCSFLEGHGYTGYIPQLQRELNGSCRFHLEPFADTGAFQVDTVWVPRGVECPMDYALRRNLRPA